uniref:Putative 5.3 kDa protein n=1 Tax=Ixodes ricinus TaxID=34613 RepID=A0A6B0U0Y8_IXORI
MRAPAIVIISVLLLDCFHSVECYGRPVRSYQSKPFCRRPCDIPQNCGPPCARCPPTNPWTPKTCKK